MQGGPAPAGHVFENISGPQLTTHVTDVDAAPTIGKARIAGDHRQPAGTRQSCYDLLHDAVGNGGPGPVVPARKGQGRGSIKKKAPLLDSGDRRG